MSAGAASDWEAVFDQSESDGAPVLIVGGEIDLSVAARFAQALDRLLEGAPPTAIVDLAGVGFIDSAGVRELLRALRRAEASGGTLVLRSPSSACRRVLDLSGILGEFTLLEEI